MADDPKDGGGSLLGAAVGLTPLGIGIGVAAKREFAAGLHIPPDEPAMTRSLDALRNPATTPRVPSANNMLEFMRKGGPGSTALTGDVARQAWDWAGQGLKKNVRERLLTFTAGLETMADKDVIRAIEQTLRQNESEEMVRMFRRFKTNVAALETHKAIFGSLPDFKPMAHTGDLVQSFRGPMDKGIAAGAESLAQKLGATLHSRGFERQGFHGVIWEMVFKGGKGGDFSVMVPEAIDNIMAEGFTFQTRRYAPDMLVKTAEGMKVFTPGEMFLKEIESSIVPDIGSRLKSQTDVHRAISQARAATLGIFESLPAVPESMLPEVQQQHELLRSQRIRLMKEVGARKIWDGSPEFVPSFTQMGQEEVDEFMRSAEGRRWGLTGGVGPRAAMFGYRSTAQWEKYYLTPEAIDHGRRTEQAYRRFQLTAETDEHLRSQERFRRYRNYETKAARGERTMRVGMRAVYVDPDRHAKLLSELFMGEGEAIGRREMGRMSFESLETAKLRLRPDLVEKGFKGVKVGEILGTTIEGKPFVYQEGMDIVGSTAFSSPGAGEYHQLSYMQHHQFRHGSKVFGDAKALVLLRQKQEIDAAVRSITSNRETAAATDMLINMDTLKKNKALHNKQMITSLAEVVHLKNQTRRIKNGEKVLQLLDVEKFSSTMSNLATKGGVYDTAAHSRMVGNLMRFAAEEVKVSAEQFGSIFGSVPYVLGEEEAERLARQGLAGTTVGGFKHSTNRYIGAMSQGVAGGVAHLAFGGPPIDVGGLGALEPRAFEILAGKAWGKQGAAIAEELKSRMAIAQPHVVAAHQELGKTLSSITGELKMGADARVFDVTKTGYDGRAFQTWMEKGGGWISPGKSLPNIYVPGADKLQHLLPHETAGGIEARTVVSNAYHDLGRQAAALSEGRLTTKEFTAEMEKTAEVLRKQWAPLGKGLGAIGRGKVAGSAYLRGVSTSAAGVSSAIRDSKAVGISLGAFKNMAQQMIEAGYDRGEMEAMVERFRSGQQVSGILTRHPYIGEFSLQPTNFRMVADLADDQMILPELEAKVTATSSAGSTVTKTIKLGPLVGLSGDKDADAFSAMLLSPDKEKELRRSIMTNDNAFTQRYMQHQVRMQLFQPKKVASEGMTTISKMIGDVSKLGSGQRWVGSLSMQLTRAKEAVQIFGKGAGAADARFLMEWLEQTPISSKHLSAAQAGELPDLMRTLISGLESHNAERMELAVKKIMVGSGVAEDMLTGNVRLDKAGAEEIARITGTKVDRNIQGVNLTQAIKTMMEAMDEYQARGGAEALDFLSGRGRYSISRFPELMGQGTTSVLSKVSSATTTATNIAARLGKGIIKHHKTIGLGFAGSLAVAAALSDPNETIGPGSRLIPQASTVLNMAKGSSRLKQEDVMPAGQETGSPSAPSRLAPRTARIDTANPGRRVQVRARATAGVNSAAVGGALSGLSRNTNINLRDNRSAILPHEISNKLM